MKSVLFVLFMSEKICALGVWFSIGLLSELSEGQSRLINNSMLKYFHVLKKV